MILDTNGKLLHKGSDTRHNRMVVKILQANPGAHCERFRERVEKALIPAVRREWGKSPRYLRVLHENCLRDLYVRPDAFLIKPAEEELVCWEVEDGHRYTAGKYYSPFWLLDDLYWKLRIIRVDAITGGELEVDAFEEAVAMGKRLKAEAAEECRN